MMSNRVPSIPADLSQLAILLDVDGTLLDFAPTPREVFVSHALRETLGRLWERTGGAVAFVSGRPVNELDLIFSPLQLPAIGGHGAELRTIPGAAPESPRLPPPPAARPQLETAVCRHRRGGSGHHPRRQGLLAGAALPAGAGEGTH